MANCTDTDVRRIIETALSPADLTALIILSDQEISDRNLSGNANIKKTISMWITASMAAAKDPSSSSTGDYNETINTAKDYRDYIEDYIRRTRVPRVRRG